MIRINVQETRCPAHSDQDGNMGRGQKMNKTLFPDLRTANVYLEVNVVPYIDLERVSDYLFYSLFSGQ